MKNGAVIWIIFTFCAAVGGYWAGRQHNPPTAASPAVTAVDTATNHPVPSVVPSSLADTSEVVADFSSGKMSLMDVTAGLLVLKASGDFGVNNDPDQKWTKLLLAVNPSDIPQVLAFADKTLTSTMRSTVRTDLLGPWTDAAPAAAMAYARKLSDKSEREAAIGIVVQAWAERDATAAANWSQQLPAGPLRYQMLNNVLTAMALKNPAAAYDLYLRLDIASRRQGNIDADQIFAAWATKDPAAAIAKATGITSQQKRLSAYGSIVGVWADTNPQAALNWADSLTNASDKNSLLDNIATTWAGNDLNGALAYFKALPEGTAKNQVLSGLTRQWAQQDPQAAIQMWSLLPVPFLSAAARGIGGTLAEDDPQAAMDWALSLAEGPARGNAIAGVMGTLGQNDPAGAAQWAESLPPGSARNQALGELACQWAQSDPSATLNWIQTLPEGPGKMDAMENAVGQCVNQTPEAALKFIQALPPGDQQNNFFQTVAASWAQADPAAAEATIANLPEGDGKNSFLKGLVAGLAETDPVSAADYVLKLPEGNVQSDAAGSVIEQWAGSDPAAAAQWAASFTDSSRTQALQSVVQRWSNNDPVGAATWLISLPADAARENALQTYVSMVQADYPAMAAPFAIALADPDQRADAIKSVAQAWLRVDPAAGTQWLQTTALPQDQIQQILDHPEGTRSSTTPIAIPPPVSPP